ncbi:hypothetical protein CDN98_21320 [Roseateles terrae]|nr:hypothetical protein CDN98_21320 [Roseateles terrae]
MRVGQLFREEIEQALKPGETMASLVEEAVRTEVERRRNQEAFIQRGLLAIERSERQGDAVPADKVVTALKDRLAAARKQRQPRQA